MPSAPHCLADPFARPGPPAGGPRAGPGRPSTISTQSAGLCLRGAEELIAIDAESGAVELRRSFRRTACSIRNSGSVRSVPWSTATPTGLLVLETESGRQVAPAPLADEKVAENTSVPIDEGRVLLVPDRRGGSRTRPWQGPVPPPTRRARSGQRPAPRTGRCPRGACWCCMTSGSYSPGARVRQGAERWSSVLGTENLSNRLNALACDDRRSTG